VTVVTARCHNGEPHPLNSVEVMSLIGQDARITGPNGDMMRVDGHVHVDYAVLDSEVPDTIRLALTVNARSDGALGPGEVKQVGIGFVRTEPGKTVDLMNVYHDSGPPAVAAVTSAAITGARIRPVVSKYDTEWGCEQRGGHCWFRTGATNLSDPPQYHEACKHCPATRLAIPREPFRYRYPDGREG
jgi:hypothetical protein